MYNIRTRNLCFVSRVLFVNMQIHEYFNFITFCLLSTRQSLTLFVYQKKNYNLQFIGQWYIARRVDINNERKAGKTIFMGINHYVSFVRADQNNNFCKKRFIIRCSIKLNFEFWSPKEILLLKLLLQLNGNVIKSCTNENIGLVTEIFGNIFLQISVQSHLKQTSKFYTFLSV